MKHTLNLSQIAIQEFAALGDLVLVIQNAEETDKADTNTPGKSIG